MHVWHSRLLSAEALTAADLEQLSLADHERESLSGGAAAAAAARMRLVAGVGLALLQQLLQLLGRMPPGRYLLAHSPGEDTCCLFKALPPEAADAVEVRWWLGGWHACCGGPVVGSEWVACMHC